MIPSPTTIPTGLIERVDIVEFAGHGGVTSSTGYIGGSTTNWKPDLVKDESRVIAALLFRM